jgi:hypothetical protein
LQIDPTLLPTYQHGKRTPRKTLKRRQQALRKSVSLLPQESYEHRPELVISADLKERDASDVVRAHTHRYKGLRVKITGLARLSKKYTKGVKK